MKPFPILVLLSLPFAAQAADFTFDFNLTSNPGATGWAYGYTTTLGGTLNLYTEHSVDASYDIWSDVDPSDDNTPSVFLYSGGGTRNGVASGQAGLHSGPAGEFSVARYTFASAGAYDVSGFFGQGDIREVSVAVLLNGAPVFGLASTPNQADFDLTLSAGVGDTLDFVVGQGNDGYTFDSTPLSASIQAVPEPTSVVALGVAALSLLRRRRRG